MLKVIDLFAGVGGLSFGFHKTGFNIVLANEIDKEIASSYTKNQEKVRMINEDITRLEIPTVFSELKDNVDVIIGGPPCQGFSQKGSRNILDDERNFLFNYFYNVVEYVRPQYFLMENVPNILTTGGGFFKNQIFELFESIGYQIDSSVLSAYDFGVPQLRKRAFILGKRNGKLLLPTHGGNEKVSIHEAIGDLAYLNSGEGKNIQDYRLKPFSSYQKNMREGSEKLYNHVATNHSVIAIERMKMVPPGKGKEFLPKEHLTKSIYSGTWSRMIEDQPSVTITTRFDTPSSGRFTHPFLNRAITVREAARLQSFHDTFVFHGTKTSQMKQVGNAVPPLLSEKIAKAILADIKLNETIILN
ncbi:DNA cytosine methyltransferase [Sporosarcina sp. Marseille-Q4063]|uniref:DNA cytosine methyltransferase n=1 Tax=Sporosarcina sp. Marseille-Q4063 TaxID=2810514 RepID=UPI001BAEE111|nr:DNA cytosine methyltransferase [Sporosarcina sp. Marseille-Q4063]QUW20475.1 DNA cytosine methyltransferase [Sporosarcina sp. Marseille-Q4063]